MFENDLCRSGLLGAKVAGVAAAEDVAVPALPGGVASGDVLLALVDGKGVAGSANAEDGLAGGDVFPQGGELGFGRGAASHADDEEIGLLELFFQADEVVFAILEVDDGDVVVLLQFAFKEGGKGGFGLVFPLGDKGEDPGLCGIRK